MSSSTKAAKTKNKTTVDCRSPASSLSSALFDEFDKKLQLQREYFIAQLRETEGKIMHCIGGVSAELSNMRSEYKMLLERDNKLENKCHEYKGEIDRLNTPVSVLEYNFVGSDSLLLNVPNNIDAALAADNVAKTLSCDSIGIKKVFRTGKHTSPGKNLPIIVKLKCDEEREKVFRSLAIFRKNNERNLKLSDINVPGDGEVVLRECLTS